MTTKQEEKQKKDGETLTPRECSAVIVEQVLRALGPLVDPFLVKVHPLWGNRYRVNVFTGEDAVTAVIARSYFVVTDSDGVLIDCTPKIK